LKNPYINNLYEKQRQEDLKHFREGLAKDLGSYYIKDEKYSKPRNSVIIGDENGVLETREINAKELIEENMQKYKNHLMPGTSAGFVPFVSSNGNVILRPKDKKINIDGKSAYMTRPDATGNIAIELESGEVIQSTMNELKKLGVLK
ncbi:TPA: hypothetical protein R5131_001848, partial [Campylobacter coli]|nr:hypothetical protein [Campylobacter coli]